jgi:hypothetical protein
MSGLKPGLSQGQEYARQRRLKSGRLGGLLIDREDYAGLAGGGAPDGFDLGEWGYLGGDG